MPIVIRMEGTNVELGKQMLKESGLNFTTADTMSEAAEKVVALAKVAPRLDACEARSSEVRPEVELAAW